MPQPSEYETLGELSTRLAIRCGFGAQGSAGVVQNPILREFLVDAQDQLIESYEDVLLTEIVEDKAINAGQVLYDIPVNIDPHAIETVALKYGGYYTDMRRGIELYMRDLVDSGRPSNWDLRYGTTETGQIEIWPEPDTSYTLGIQGRRKRTRFKDQDDRTSIPSKMVFLVALANAKAHYNAQDAGAIGAQAEALRRNLRAKQSEGLVFDRKPRRQIDPMDRISYERSVVS